MLYPTAEEWATWGIGDECHRFFSLHWTELFDPDTPDTWQVRTCNVKTLINELIDTSRVAAEHDRYRVIIRSLLDEVFAVLKRDAILEAYYPFVSGYLEPWRKKEIGEDDPPEIERLATVILGNLDGYWDNGVRLVLELLRKADKGRKKELYDATISLGIETVARGHSFRHLRQTFIDAALVASATPFPDRVVEMFKGLAKEPAAYKCSVVPEGIKRHMAEHLPEDVKLWVGRPEKPKGGAEETFFSQIPRTGVYPGLTHLQVLWDCGVTATRH